MKNADLALALALGFCCTAAHALRCGGDLVSEEDTPAEVRAACGEPEARYHQDLSYSAKQGPQEIERFQPLDIWVYRPGANALLQILVFQNDRLKRIENGDYGSHYEANRQQCEGPLFGIAPGAWAPEIELRCGSPDEKRLLERRDQAYAGQEPTMLTRQVMVELWRYHFPASGRTAELRLENGQLKLLNWE